MIRKITFSEANLTVLRISLLDWFEANGRHAIPWKLKIDGTQPDQGELIDPYPIWVAEVMLQQTQLKTVLPYWKKWMKTFPSLAALAKADQQEVLLLWQGLGYYARARRLHQSSKILLKSLGTKKSLDPTAWPKDLESWMALPGIGRSTAGSIVSSAFDSPSPILDGNVKRLLARLIASPKLPQSQLRQFWILSEQLLDRKSPRNFNQALMDFGSIVCKVKKPICYSCPLRSCCNAYYLGEQTFFPVQEQSKDKACQLIGVGIVINDSGQVLIDQRLNQGLLGGMWEFPGGKQEPDENIQETIVRELQEELGILVEVGEKLIAIDHSYSHKKMHFEVYLCRWLAGEPKPLASQQVRWVYPENLEDYPFPAANAQMIAELKKYLLRDN